MLEGSPPPHPVHRLGGTTHPIGKEVVIVCLAVTAPNVALQTMANVTQLKGLLLIDLPESDHEDRVIAGNRFMAPSKDSWSGVE